MNTSELTERQKEWLEIAGIPAEGERLTEKQSLFLSYVGEMMGYLETKYQTGFRFSACVPPSVADPKVILYAYQEQDYSPLDVVEVIRSSREGNVALTDNYAVAYTRQYAQERVGQFFAERFGAEAVQVYAQLVSNDEGRFDGTQSPQELLESGQVSGMMNIFLKVKPAPEEQEALANQWGQLVQEQGLRLTGKMCFVNEEQFGTLNDYTFDQISGGMNLPDRFIVSVDNEGTLICHSY